MTDPIRHALDNAFTYAEYRAHLTALLDEGRTTGPNQSATYLDAARINQSRMDRLDRRSRLDPALTDALRQAAPDRLLVLVITEGWCGDAAQTVPVLQWLAAAHPGLDLRLVLRDEHPALMDRFLTDGARSIPIFIFLNPDTLEVLASWGPRPAPAQEIAMAYKHADPRPGYDAYQKELHTWYARDKTRTLQEELGEVVNSSSR